MKPLSASRSIGLGVLLVALSVLSATALWRIGATAVDPEVRAGENHFLASAVLLQVARRSSGAEQEVLQRTGYTSVESGLKALIDEGNKLHQLRERTGRLLVAEFMIVWFTLTILCLTGIRMIRHGLVARRRAAGHTESAQRSAV